MNNNMKLTNRMTFVMDMLSERLVQVLFVVLMGVVSFLLIDMSIMTVLEQRQTDLLAKEILTVDKDQVYHVSDANLYNVMNIANQTAFGTELIQDESWAQLCVYGVTQGRAFSELQENSLYREMMVDAYAGTQMMTTLRQIGKQPEEMMYLYTANENALRMFGITTAGDDTDLDSITEEKRIPVYVGYDLAEFVSVGQVLSPAYLGYAKTSNPDGIAPCTCYVAGVLEKGTKVLSDHYTGNSDIAVCLDKMVLIRNEDIQRAGYLIEADAYLNNLYAVFWDKASLSYEQKQLKTKLQPLFDKYSMRLSMTSIEEMMQEERSVEESAQLLMAMAILLIIVGFLSFSTTSMVAIILRKRRYGIMLANGVSHADLAWMVLVENFLKYMLAFLISFGVMHWSYASSQPYSYSGMNEYMTYLTMHLQYALPVMLVLLFMGTAFASALPVRYMKRMDLRMLLQEQ